MEMDFGVQFFDHYWLLYLDSIDVIVLSNLNVFFTITMFSGAFALCMSDIEIDHNGEGQDFLLERFCNSKSEPFDSLEEALK